MWLSLISAVTGAVIATASAALLDHRRWRRDQVRHLTDTRRVLYGEYLANLAKTRNHFRSLARDRDVTPKDRAASARTSFAPCYEGRYQIAITGSAKVVAASEETFKRLRDIRDATGAGARPEDDSYAEGRREFESSLARLRKEMRDELGSDRTP
jgi:hypothetical protein